MYCIITTVKLGAQLQQFQRALRISACCNSEFPLMTSIWQNKARGLGTHIMPSEERVANTLEDKAILMSWTQNLIGRGCSSKTKLVLRGNK